MFTFRGRINRTTFLLGNLFISLLVLPFYAFDENQIKRLESNAAISIVALLIAVCVIYFSLCLVIRRLHDVGLSAWFAILAFLPGVQLVLLVLPSQKIKNRYGSVPTQRFATQTLFTS